MILVIDNYDSFVYNLVQAFGVIEPNIHVVRNDAITVGQIRASEPDAIIISPGPGTPKEAGISIDVIRELGPHVPILGVCLGHQAIGVAYGASVTVIGEPVHGKASIIHHNGKGLFENMPQAFSATRYHSLHVERGSISDCLKVTAETGDGLVMAMRHVQFPTFGLQFHLESILTEGGNRLVEAFLRIVSEWNVIRNP